ncbi:MAG TPA: DUF1963 domain-containing protein [Blastocatellia bacterium]|nr:DUF1963 domain-containing protein [Blastocatellia bacterium]
MKKKYSIGFKLSNSPISKPVTKFGGQPVWINQIQWPISKKTGKPMMFIGQIKLEPKLFGRIESKMAYIFMTEDKKGDAQTWDPYSEENAIIIQPGNNRIKVLPIDMGPSLNRRVKKRGTARYLIEPCEYSVQLNLGEDPEYITEYEREDWDAITFKKYAKALNGNKIGGTPIFLQGDEFPKGGPWNLLLQLDSTKVPFLIDFGDSGNGYAFISKDGKKAKFLWQCL